MDALQTKLKKYRSSFDVLESLPTNKESIKKIKDKLEQEVESEEYDIGMQYHRTWNLISFLWFVLHEKVKAEALNTKVLENDPDNIIALSNKAWFAIKKKNNFKQCSDICKTLENLSESIRPKLVAEAEIAFTYSRLRIGQYEKSILIYKEVIEKCDSVEVDETDGNNKIPIDYFCTWVFGHASIQKRLMNVSNIQDETKLDISSESYHRLIELYRRIIGLKTSSALVKRYQARSYVDLGSLRYSVEEKFPLTIQGIFSEYLDLPEQADKYFEKAIEIFPEDPYVLERSGQYFRYSRKLEHSIHLLTTAVEKKGNSYAYHHLALSLRRKLDIKTGNLEHKPVRRKCKDLTNKTEPTISLAKSPLKPKQIHYESNKIAVDTIILYFDKSIEMSSNIGAMYDKGLFYRQLNKPDKALEIFECLLQNEDENHSRFYFANAYEQAGLCIRSMLEKHLVRDQDKVEMEHKMKMYLKSSIEISCCLVARIPNLENCWKSAPTLHTILLGEASTKENKEDLLFLYNKMHRHKEALTVLIELEKMAETEGESIQIFQEIVEKFLLLGMYDDAVVALGIKRLLPNGLENLDEKLCRQVYTEAGIDALKKRYEDIARKRIKNALEIGIRNDTNATCSSQKRDLIEERYDVFFLCNIYDEDKGRQLMDIFNRTGLNTTLNTDRQRPGTSELAGITDAMKESKHFLIIFDFDAEDKVVANWMQHLIERLQTIIQEREKGTSRVMVIKTIACEKVPDMFLGYRAIDMELPTDPEEDFTKNESICKCVKEIIMAITSNS